MKSIEIKGTNLNEIISSYRKEYKIKDWELQYEVLSKPTKGLFGLFANKEATIRFNLPSSEERVKLFLEQLLAYMEIKYDNIQIKTEQKTVYATINSPTDAGFLIGKNGNMLEQIQYLLNRVFENVPNLERIYLDTEDYRYRQEQTFIRNYIPLINKVKTTGKSVTLEPMQSSDRRIIHKYVEGERSLKTLTIGDGDNRRIVIMPAAQKDTQPPKRTGFLKKNETKKREEPVVKDEMTHQQRAAQSYKKHNRSYSNSHHRDNNKSE